MSLTTKQKTMALITISQIPMLLLLIIFFNIPGLPASYRIMGLVTVLFEAALMTELIGNIVQKVRANVEYLYVREVLERKRIPWDKVQSLRQAVVSPMKRGSTQTPAKAFLVKTDMPVRLLDAEEWWIKKGPLSNRRHGMLDLVEKYDAYVRKSLKGWLVLWDVEYRRPQAPGDLVEVEYLSLDGRENVIIDELSHHTKAKELKKVWDLTYPSFFKQHGEKYKKEPEYTWDTITT